jgi:hypothetical protein
VSLQKISESRLKEAVPACYALPTKISFHSELLRLEKKRARDDAVRRAQSGTRVLQKISEFRLRASS